MPEENPQPFFDTSSQESQTLSLIIEEIKDPTRRIYHLCKEYHWPHGTCFTRMLEKIFLSPKGEKINLDFNDKKTERTLRVCFMHKLPPDVRKQIFSDLREISKSLDGCISLPADIAEQMVLGFAKAITVKFMEDLGKPEVFHEEKRVLLNSYNEALDPITEFNTTIQTFIQVPLPRVTA